MWAAPRVVNRNCYSHHAWLLRRRQGLFFVIRWFSCGVAPVFRPRQPTVSAPRLPPASFDATHGHVSLFYFHFSRRERAATQLVALGRNGPLSTHNENKNARCHCKRRRVSCPGPGRAADVILAFVRPNKTAFMSDKCLIFGFTCGVHRVPVRRARPRSIDVEFDQPKPAHLRPSSTLHPGGANKHRRCPQRPAGAPGANASLYTRNGCIT